MRPSRSTTRRSPTRSGLGVVRDHHDRLVELVDGVAQQPQHLGARLGVEVAGGLVGEHDRRARDERARDRDALLLAARQLGGTVLAPVGQARPSRSAGRPTAWSMSRPAIVSGSVMFSSAVRTGSRLKAWKMKPIFSRRRSVRRLSSSVVISTAVDRHRARRRAVEPGQAVHQGRLAGPGGPHDRGVLAAHEADRDAVERVHGGLALAEVLVQVRARRRSPTSSPS